MLNLYSNYRFAVGLMFAGLSCLVFSQTLPHWVSNPTSDTHDHMFSVGAAPDYEQAKKNAMAALAGKFNSRVAETFSSFYQEKPDGVEELTTVDTVVEIDDTDLSHFEFTKNERVDGQYWVEIQLNKVAFATGLNAKWRNLDLALEKLVQLLPNTSSIEALLIAEDISTMIPKAAQLLSQLMVVEPDPMFGRRLSSYGVYLSEIKQMRSELSINLINVSASNNVFELVKEELGLRGVKVNVKESDFKGSDSSIAVYEQSKTEKDARGAYLVYQTLTLETKDNEQSTLANRIFSTQIRDYSESILEIKTISALKNRLKKSSLSEMLGLEK